MRAMVRVPSIFMGISNVGRMRGRMAMGAPRGRVDAATHGPDSSGPETALSIIPTGFICFNVIMIGDHECRPAIVNPRDGMP
jgi:hypothetical protein